MLDLSGPGGEMLWRYVLGVDTNYSLRHEQLWPVDADTRDTSVVSWHSRHECGTPNSIMQPGASQ